MRRTPAITLLAALFVPVSIGAQEITPDVVYGHKDGLALTYDVIHPTGTSNGAAVAFMVSGGWVSRWRPPEQMARAVEVGLGVSGPQEINLVSDDAEGRAYVGRVREILDRG